jgi:hypothetical protein
MCSIKGIFEFYCFSQLKEISEFSEINIVTIYVII